VTGAIAAAPAGAQAPAWQPPATVSRPTAFLFGEQIAFDRAGNAVVTWTANAGKRTFADPTSGPGKASFRVAVRPASSDRWGRERVLPYAIALPPFGDGRAYATEVTRSGAIRVHTVTLTGRRIRTQTLQSPDRLDRGPFLAVNARGDAVVAWTARVRRDQRVFAALARRGGRFGSVAALSRSRPVGGPTVAIGPRGDAVVAWPHQRTSVHAAIAPAGRAFGGRQRVGPTRNGNAISVAVGVEGAAAIAWTSQSFEAEGGPTSPADLRVSYARPRGRFELGGRPATGMSVDSPRVVFDSNRNAVVVWRDGTSIRTAEIGPNGITVPPAPIYEGSDPVEIRALSGGPNGGRALVLWLVGDISVTSAPTQLWAAYRPALTSPFGPPEPVSPSSESVIRGTAALHPRAGSPTAVWERELGGPNGRVLESSVRR
jgi:hypothetical protein